MPKAVFFLILACGIPPKVFAQRYHDPELPLYELGLRFDVANFGSAGSKAGGGVTFHYNFNHHLALDSQFTFGPATVVANGHTTFLMGVRAGQRVEDCGFFLHARGGFLHYDNSTSSLSRNSFPAFDLGGTLEFYEGAARQRWGGSMVFRLEMGALIVPYGNATIIPSDSSTIGSPPPPTGSLGTRVGPIIGLGIGFRF
jgi:hypothetical protein